MAQGDKQEGGGLRVDELVLTRVGDDAVIRPLDGVTMDEVKRVVQSERNRNRRVVVWTGTLLLGIFLFFLVIFLSIGLYVVRGRDATATALLALRERDARLIAAVGAVSNQVASLARERLDLESVLARFEEADVARGREFDALQVDVRTLRDAAAAVGDAAGADQVAAVQERLQTMESTLAEARDALRAELEDAVAASRHAEDVPIPVWGLPPGDDEAGAAPAEPDVALDGVALNDAALEAAGIFEPGAVAPVDPGGERREIQVVEFPNGDHYEGELERGLLHGWGIYVHRNGDRYDGQFRDGLKEGRGTLVYADGGKYVGDFRADLREGRGSMAYANGDRYVGEFGNDLPSGRGTMLYANGNKYAGGFHNGMRQGNGLLRFSNGDIYRGAFRNDERTGKGTYAFTDGTRYIGDFDNGRRHGQGRYIYADGAEYIGEFREGMREGTGESIYPNGKRVKGLWREDRLVRQLGG